MNHVFSNLDPALAEDLLGLIEGESVSPAARARIEAAFAASPGLRTAVAAMRADRAALVELGAQACAAPAGLLARVEDDLDAAALRDLAGTEARTPASMAVSRIEYDRPGILASIFGSPWVRPMAAAASLALLAGGTLYGVAALSHRKAATPTLTSAGSPESLDPLHAAELPTPSPERAVAATTPDDVTASEPAATAIATATPAAEPAIPEARPPFGMTLDRAMELAAQGRLMIRARSASPESALAHFGAMAARPVGTREVHTLGDQAAHIALAARPAPPAAPPAGTPASAAPTFAAESAQGPSAVDSKGPVAAAPARWEALPQAFAAQLASSPRALRTMLDRLAKSKLVEIELIESTASIDAEAIADPANMLWWMSTATWDRPAIVPIVIETPAG